MLCCYNGPVLCAGREKKITLYQTSSEFLLADVFRNNNNNNYYIIIVRRVRRTVRLLHDRGRSRGVFFFFNFLYIIMFSRKFPTVCDMLLNACPRGYGRYTLHSCCSCTTIQTHKYNCCF